MTIWKNSSNGWIAVCKLEVIGDGFVSYDALKARDYNL
jgi:hypothetical protein